MVSKTNDGRWFWTVCVAVIAIVFRPVVVQAQAPHEETAKCDMRLIDAPKPVYPKLHDKQTLKSMAVADLEISDDGMVKAVRLSRSSGIRKYDNAIVQALKKWRYNEATGCRERY